MTYTVGKPSIFGIREPKPITNIPMEAIKVKLRLRAQRPAYAFVSFEDRIEQWTIGPADMRTIACPTWCLSTLVAVNQTTKPAPRKRVNRIS